MSGTIRSSDGDKSLFGPSLIAIGMFRIGQTPSCGQTASISSIDIVQGTPTCFALFVASYSMYWAGRALLLCLCSLAREGPLPRSVTLLLRQKQLSVFFVICSSSHLFAGLTPRKQPVWVRIVASKVPNVFVLTAFGAALGRHDLLRTSVCRTRRRRVRR